MKWMLKSFYDKIPDLYLNGHHTPFKKMKNKTLLKTVDFECRDVVYKLVKKERIEHVIFPEEVVLILSWDRKIAYQQQHMENMKNLSSFSEVENNFSDREILTFFKSMLVTLKNLHKSGVVSGDITYSNIIIDKNLDYRFIDFDYAFVDEKQGGMAHRTRDTPYLDCCNETYLRSMYSEKDMFLYLDKANLVNIMLHAFLNGEVIADRDVPRFLDFSSLEMEEWVVSRFYEFLDGNIYTKNDDYLLEVMDYLIESDYTLPYRSLRRKK